MKQILTLSLFSSLPGLALAHGDHGATLADGLRHMLSDGVHLWPLVLLAILAVSLQRPVRRWLRQRTKRND